jgi:hypothetical protein
LILLLLFLVLPELFGDLLFLLLDLFGLFEEFVGVDFGLDEWFQRVLDDRPGGPGVGDRTG